MTADGPQPVPGQPALPRPTRPGFTSPRLELRHPAELDDDARALYDRIVSGPRKSQAGQAPITDPDGALLGPFGLMTLAPAVGDAIQQVGAALRFATGLSPLVREAAILLVAAHHGSDFEWFAHVGLARAAGLTPRAIAALGAGELPVEVTEGDAAQLRVVQELLATGTLDDEAYTAARAELGERTLAELVWLCGYYGMLALALAVFDPPNPMETEAPPWRRAD